MNPKLLRMVRFAEKLTLFFALCCAVAIPFSFGARAVADQPTVIHLLDRPNQIVLAGGSSYLAIAMQDPPMCAVLDVKSGTIVKELPMRNKRCILAGTLSHVLMIDPVTKAIDWWSLPTWKREPTLPLRMMHSIDGAASGPFSNGPLLILSATQSAPRTDMQWSMLRLDPFSLMEPEPNTGANILYHPLPEQNPLTASGDGCIFDLSTESCSFQSLGSTFRQIRKLDLVPGVLPDFSGSTYYSKRGRYFFRGDPTSRIATAPEVFENITSWTPALDSDWSVIHRTAGGAEIIPPGTTEPAIRIAKVAKHAVDYADPFARRLYLLTSQSTLLETSNTPEIRLHRFDLNAAKLQGHFLHPTSTPNTSITAGELFEYPIQTISSTKEFAVELALGPHGMSLKSNALRWSVPSDAPNAIHQVVLQLANNAGSKCFHSFRLRVAGRNASEQEPNPRSEVIHQAATAKRSRQDKKSWSELLLPAIPSDMALIGGSRFLALTYPELPLIDIVDVATKSIRSIPLEFVASFSVIGTAKKLFLVTHGGVFLVYDIENFQLQKIKAIPNLRGVDQAIAGTYGNGPIGLVASYSGVYGLTLLDEESLEPLKNTKPLKSGFKTGVSPDGRVFCFYEEQLSFYDLAHFDMPKENPINRYLNPWLHPNFNGSFFYDKDGMVLRDGKRLAPDKHLAKSTFRTIVPSVHGNLFVTADKTDVSNDDSALEATIYRTGSSEPLLKLLDLPFVSQDSFQVYERNEPNTVTRLLERIHLIPEHQTLAMLLPGERKLYFRDFDLIKALNDNRTYLPDNVAPANAYAGKTYSHTLEIIGTNAPYQFSFQEAPKGAKIEKNTIVWKVPADHPLGVVTLRVNVEDKEKKSEIFPIPIQVTRYIGTEVSSPVVTNLDSRNWTVANKLMVGSFVRIVDKRSVEIMLPDRTLTQIAIGDLGLDDIEYAVKMDSQASDSKDK